MYLQTVCISYNPKNNILDKRIDKLKKEINNLYKKNFKICKKRKSHKRLYI